MKPKISMFATFLLVAGFAAGQDSTSHSTLPNTPTAPTSDAVSSPTGKAAVSTASSLSGCLSGSAESGSFTLTDPSGTAYSLAGDNGDLRTLIGSEIQVTGQLMDAASNSMSGINANAGTNPSDRPLDTKTFHVTGVTKLADACSANKTSTNGPSAAKRNFGETIELAALQTGSATGSGQTGTTGQTGSSTSTQQQGTATTTPGTMPSATPENNTTPDGATAAPTPGTASPNTETAAPTPRTATPNPKPEDSETVPGSASPGSGTNVTPGTVPETTPKGSPSSPPPTATPQR